jgi:hypothetical protein
MDTMTSPKETRMPIRVAISTENLPLSLRTKPSAPPTSGRFRKSTVKPAASRPLADLLQAAFQFEGVRRRHRKDSFSE